MRGLYDYDAVSAMVSALYTSPFPDEPTKPADSASFLFLRATSSDVFYAWLEWTGTCSYSIWARDKCTIRKNPNPQVVVAGSCRPVCLQEEKMYDSGELIQLQSQPHHCSDTGS